MGNSAKVKGFKVNHVAGTGKSNVWERIASMGIHYIKREEVKVDIERFNKKYKDKYRFKARAYAVVYYESNPEDEYASWNYNKNRSVSGNVVYSKTKKGAEVSALNSLFHQCRPPLSKKQKIENKKVKGKCVYKRFVLTEVRVSNSLDFIMNDDDVKKNWNEIRREDVKR